MYDVDTFTSSFLPSLCHLLHTAVSRAQSKSVSQSVSGSININQKAIFQVDNKQTFIQIIEKEAI
jgi:hypothetical protein